jgi:hypothetical protein
MVGEAVEAYGLGMVGTAGSAEEAGSSGRQSLGERGMVTGAGELSERPAVVSAGEPANRPAVACADDLADRRPATCTVEEGAAARSALRPAVPAPRAASEQPLPPPSATFRDLPRRFWLNQLAGVFSGAIEFCLTLWCATLLRDRAHLSAGVAATGVTAVVAGMAVGRAAGGRLALRVPIDRLIYASFGTNLLGFALFWATADPVLMFGGLAVAGLGVSLQFPLLSARGIEMSGGEAELAGAVNMFGSGIAVGTAPFALGFLSDRVGIHTAYLLLPAFIGIAVLAVAASGRRGSIPA